MEPGREKETGPGGGGGMNSCVVDGACGIKPANSLRHLYYVGGIPAAQIRSGWGLAGSDWFGARQAQ